MKYVFFRNTILPNVPVVEIDWPSQQNRVSEADLYIPHTKLLDWAYLALDSYEMYHISSIRKV